METEKLAVSMTIFILLVATVLAATVSSAGPMLNGTARVATTASATTGNYLPDALPLPAEWNKTYGGAEWDVANSVVQTGDGGYMLAGFTQSFGAGGGDFWLVRTNSAGRMLWNRTYGGSDYDEAQSLIQTADGGYALAGVTRSYGAGVTDFWLVKIDSNGNSQWNRTYGGAGLDYLFSAIQTSDNGFALVGYTESYGQGGDFWLVKADSNGIMQWSETYGGSGWDEAHAVIQTSDGGYAIVGETDSIGAGSTDVWWVKAASDGKKQRDQTYGGVNADGAYSLVQTSDGGYAIAGYTESFGYGVPSYPDFWLVRVDSAGRSLWEKTYGGLNADSAQALIVTGSGGFAIAGATMSYGGGDQDFWLVTSDSAGGLNWNQTYGGFSLDYSYSVVETGDSGFVLAGDTFSYGKGSGDMWLVKVEGSIPRHDVAVVDVTPYKTVIGQGYSSSINVTVENQGNRLETINATVYANASIVDKLIDLQTIAPGSIKTLTLTWNTAQGEFPNGSYTIKAESMITLPVIDDDPADNSLVDGLVNVSIPGDVNADGSVDVSDVYALGKAYASYYAYPNWNANCDIDNNGTVDLADLSVIRENYGEATD